MLVHSVLSPLSRCRRPNDGRRQTGIELEAKIYGLTFFSECVFVALLHLLHSPTSVFFSSLRIDGDVDLPEFAIAFRTHTHSLHNYTYDIDDELICALAFIDRFNFDVYDSRLTTIYPNSITANR